MRIGPVDTRTQVAIVAEIGNNHEGDVAVAAEMVRAAAAAGAHAVKFQAIDPGRLVAPTETDRLAQLERFRLTPEEFRELHALARELGVGFLCTPFDLGAVDWLAPLVDAFKIASGDNDFVALIRAAADSGRPVIVSSGMTDIDQMLTVREVVVERGAEFLALHCVSEYPAPPERAQLATIPSLAAALDGPVGYSDHTLGNEACLIAVALGARVLEKHFTLRHDYSAFRDHQLSADPDELADLVQGVERVRRLLGTPRAGLSEAEQAVAGAARRSAVALADLPVGHVVRASDVAWLRPGGGVSPSVEDRLVGRTLTRSVSRGERLDPAGLDPPL